MFNHKGGVGKTSLTYNLSWKLAELDKKVLMIDADAQQNLSLIVRGKKQEEADLASQQSMFPPQENFWEDYYNIYDLFQEFLSPGGYKKIKKPIFTKKHENLLIQNGGKLDLLLGSLDIDMLARDLPLMLAQTDAKGLAHQFQLAVDHIAKDYDFVIIDLSPSISHFNLLMVAISHYWIAPMFPNHFCYKAMQSIKTVLGKFHQSIISIKKGEMADGKGIDVRYKFLGYVTQGFTRNNKGKDGDNNVVHSFGIWQQEINKKAIELAHYLGYDGAISQHDFEKIFSHRKAYNLAEISNFNRLGVMSQNHGIPSYKLTMQVIDKENKEQLGRKSEKNSSSDDFVRMQSWEDSYTELALSLCKLP